ncbi:MAG: ORF6N domain-containing protein [Magnetococcales bacterium]|nr:ORF6N domain-containing protein [Magnetococcales bacterium]
MITENSNSLVSIGDTSLSVLEYRGRRVITFSMVDQVHQRPEGTARKRFNDNKERFVAGEDYFHLSFHEVASLSEFRTAGLQPNSQGLVILSQSGYLMLVKSFTDDLAWRVQRELVNRYFQTVPTSTAHQLFLMAKAVWEQEERVRQLEQTSTDQQRQIDAIAQRQANMDGDTGYMTALAFCRREKIPAPLTLARRLGVMATDLCRDLGIRTGQVPDERWGTVNSYPVEVLQDCLATMNEQAA